MSAKYEELIEAGAPRLPEGYYYKIDTCSNDSGRMVRIRIYRERAWWFDQLQGRRYVEYVKCLTTVQHLADCCKIAHRGSMPATLSKAIEPFLGRHP